MEISSLKTGALKIWVPFIQGARIQVRHVARDEFQALLEKCTTRELLGGEIKEDFDNSKFNSLLFKTAVTDLEGFTENGESAPFSPELAALLIEKSSQFVIAVRSVCTDLDRLYGLAAEETKKK